jgi:hypothetical protein
MCIYCLTIIKSILHLSYKVSLFLSCIMANNLHCPALFCLALDVHSTILVVCYRQRLLFKPMGTWTKIFKILMNGHRERFARNQYFQLQFCSCSFSSAYLTFTKLNCLFFLYLILEIQQCPCLTYAKGAVLYD